MYLEKKICVVVPAHDEETQIASVIETMPGYVDSIVIVDDASKDNTVNIVAPFMHRCENIVLIRHDVNQGVGGSISSGYKWARDHQFDITAVMAGDGQMEPTQLINIIHPVAIGEVDYAKGNRLFFGDAWHMIPHLRYLGNAFLSLMTKIVSGYWHIADSQSGYTAISLTALKRVDPDTIYKRYGMPNDLLIKLNLYDFKVRDVHIMPIYNIGEKSGIRLAKVIPSISWLLFKGFWKRLMFKYVIKDFHPLVFFYVFAFLLIGASLPLTVRLFYIWAITGNIPDINAMALTFTLISGLQMLFFGMWFDMEYNKHLK